MKKLYSLILVCLVAGSCLYAAPSITHIDKAPNPADSKVNNTGSPMQPDNSLDGRAFGDILATINLSSIGMPGDGYDNAGLTWDGQYLYLISMYDNRVYVIDPTGPSLVTNWPAQPTLSWGCGHESDIWMTEYNTISAYEFTWGGTFTGNSFSCLAGGAVWMGDVSEWWANGEVWIIAVGGSNKAYKFSVPSGTLLDSISDPTWTATSQRGLSYDPYNDKFFVGGWNNDILWELNSDGSLTGRQATITNLASIAYDWQSEATPVIWCATNEVTNIIHKVDAANPSPIDTVVWDFETGWQGWTKTGAYAFPNGWGVATSGLHSGWQPPTPDDSCLWFDDDAAGSGAPALQDTAKSPLLVPDPDETVWLKWGVTFNYLSGGEYLEIGIKYFDGASWTVVPLRTYAADVAGAWDSADVSAYNDYDLIQIYAYYDDAAGWKWYGAIDNISIIGMLFQGYQHDASCDAIMAPGVTVMPNTVVAPVAHYENSGINGETFDVYFDIDSAGVNVYSQTYNVSLPAGEDTLVTFPDWTAGSNNGIVYDCYAYTVLSGDEVPANDTTYRQVTVNSMFWEILDPPAFPSPTYGHAMASANDGFHITFSAGASNNETVIYDIASNTWASGAACPTGTHAFPACGYVNGNFYLVGGWNGSAATNQVDIYNSGSNSWSTGATAPMNIIDCATGVYKDTMLYTIGGGNWFSSVGPHNMVHVYNTATNSWTQATSFPGSPRGCPAGGVIDSFIIVEGGYDGAAMRIDYVRGVINASNPATITWGSPTNVPGIDSLYRIPCAVDISNKELWITCGQFWGNTMNRTYSYSPYTDTWTEWAYPKPQAVCNLTPVVITETAVGDLGLFVAGGYYGGSSLADHEVFHTGLTGVAENPFKLPVSQKFGFAPNMPNPVSGYTSIQYSTTLAGRVSLKIYDGSGRLIKTLVDRVNEMPGTKTVYWNGMDNHNQAVSNGVYFVQLEAENKTDTYKLILVK